MPAGRPPVAELAALASPPWARRLGDDDPERDAPWAAFQLYLDGGLDRSLAKVRDQVGVAFTTVKEWSSRHDWVVRAAAWDEHVRARQLAYLEQAGPEVAVRQAREGADVERVLFQRVLEAVAAGEVEAKDALSAYVGIRKDNRAAVGLGGNTGPTVNVQTNVAVSASFQRDFGAAVADAMVIVGLPDEVIDRVLSLAAGLPDQPAAAPIPVVVVGEVVP